PRYRRRATTGSPLPWPRERSSCVGRRLEFLEPHARRGPRRDARSDGESAGQWLAAVSNAVLPILGTQWLLPIGRGLWLSRPIAGRGRSLAHRTATHPRTSAAMRRSSVSGRRRAALVASADWSWRPHAFFRRLSVAAVHRLSVRDGDRRHGHP